MYINDAMSKIDCIQIPSIDTRGAKYQGGQISPGGVVCAYICAYSCTHNCECIVYISIIVILFMIASYIPSIIDRVASDVPIGHTPAAAKCTRAARNA